MVDETPTAGAAATNLTYGLESIPIFTAMAETPVSLNMLEDAAYPVEQHLARAFAEAAAIEEDNQFLAGDGNGKPQGILPGSANALSLSYGHNTTATNAVEWDGIIDTVYEIDSQYRQNAVWIAKKATYRDIAKLKSDNAYLWKQDQQAGQARSLEGYPVLEQEQMPSVAANAYVAIFGDLRGYTIADRVGMSIERFDDSAVRRQNMTMFFMRRRYGGKVMEPWRFVLYKIATS
jgi:HK97 family phage major capsid protein